MEPIIMYDSYTTIVTTNIDRNSYAPSLDHVWVQRVLFQVSPEPPVQSLNFIIYGSISIISLKFTNLQPCTESKSIDCAMRARGMYSTEL